MDDINTLSDTEAWILVAIAVIVIAVVFVFTWALLRTAQYPPSTTLVLALSMLTLVALVSFAITRSETLGTIAAAGIGALAGSVTAQFAKDDTIRESIQRERELKARSELDPDE
jgi:chromate transport protein ChrA